MTGRAAACKKNPDLAVAKGFPLEAFGSSRTWSTLWKIGQLNQSQNRIVTVVADTVSYWYFFHWLRVSVAKISCIFYMTWIYRSINSSPWSAHRVKNICNLRCGRQSLDGWIAVWFWS